MQASNILKNSFKTGLTVGLTASIMLTLIVAGLLQQGWFFNRTWTENNLKAFLILSTTYTLVGVLVGVACAMLERALRHKTIGWRAEASKTILLFNSTAWLLIFGMLGGRWDFGLAFSIFILAAGIIILLPFKHSIPNVSVKKIIAGLILFNLAFATNIILRQPARNDFGGNFPDCAPAEFFPGFDGKIIVFGFDGASLEVMKPLIDAGRLPNMEKLMRNGVYGDSESLSHRGKLMSPVVWTSIFTGQKPEDHGIEDYLVLRLEDNFMGFQETPYTSDMRRKPALWNILSEHGVENVFTGLWSTWPAEPVEGVMVSDRFFHTSWHQSRGESENTGIVYPPAVAEELYEFIVDPNTVSDSVLAGFTEGSAYSKTMGLDRSAHPSELALIDRLKLSYSLDETYFRSAQYLDRKFNPNFIFIYLEGLDIVEHYFWGAYRPEDFTETGLTREEEEMFSQTIPRYYEYYDRLLGEMMAENPDAAFIILSDHGLQPIAERTEYFKKLHIFADHSKYGIFMAYGPEIASDRILSGVTVLDATPTILYYMGIPVSQDMDGRIIYDVFTDEFNAQRICLKVGEYHAGSGGGAGLDYRPSEDMIGKLRDLGYIA
ncbi:MAG TPA: hypothetical protein ENN13_02545 [Candidatus Altiarchaeales archaeon]|nr:hypothetical protein [Candidatus Altiarchaeales archaeon]